MGSRSRHSAAIKAGKRHAPYVRDLRVERKKAAIDVLIALDEPPKGNADGSGLGGLLRVAVVQPALAANRLPVYFKSSWALEFGGFQ